MSPAEYGIGLCFSSTVGTKIIADPEKSFQELISEKLLRTRSTTTRDRNLQFRGAVSTGGSPLDFLLFLQVLCAI